MEPITICTSANDTPISAHCAAPKRSRFCRWRFSRTISNKSQCVLYSDGTRSRPVLLNLERCNRKNRNTHYVVSSSFSAPWQKQEREWRRCRWTNCNVCRSARARLRPGTGFLTFGRDTVPSHVNPRCEHECSSAWCIFSTDSFECTRSLGSRSSREGSPFRKPRRWLASRHP